MLRDRRVVVEAACVLALGATSCSLEPPRAISKLYLDLAPLTEATRSTRDVMREFGWRISDVSAQALPTSWSSFSCYAVNVVGPGIADTSRGSKDDVVATYRAMTEGSSCAYRGIISGAVSASTPSPEVVLQVPTGPGRIVQVIGSTDATMCSSGFEGDGPSGDPVIYEIGRTRLDLYGDQALSIPVAMDFDSPAGKTVDCGSICDVLAGASVDTDTNNFLAGQKVAQKFLISGSATRNVTRAKMKFSIPAGATVVVEPYIYSGAGSTPTSQFWPPGAATSSPVSYTAPGSTGMVMVDLSFPMTYSGGSVASLAPGTYWFVVSMSSGPSGPYAQVLGDSTGTTTTALSSSGWTSGIGGINKTHFSIQDCSK